MDSGWSRWMERIVISTQEGLLARGHDEVRRKEPTSRGWQDKHGREERKRAVIASLTPLPPRCFFGRFFAIIVDLAIWREILRISRARIDRHLASNAEHTYIFVRVSDECVYVGRKERRKESGRLKRNASRGTFASRRSS